MQRGCEDSDAPVLRRQSDRNTPHKIPSTKGVKMAKNRLSRLRTPTNTSPTRKRAKRPCLGRLRVGPVSEPKIVDLPPVMLTMEWGKKSRGPAAVLPGPDSPVSLCAGLAASHRPGSPVKESIMKLRSRHWRHCRLVVVWVSILSVFLPGTAWADTVNLKNGMQLEGSIGVITTIKADPAKSGLANGKQIVIVDDE